MDELLSLKWNNHCSTFLQVLSNVRNKKKYTDVTLACDGKLYNTHKIVLSSCSDYFKDIFDNTDCKNLVVVLKDIRSEELEAILDYMYLGEVNVKQTDLASLIKVAECLQIKGLAVADDGRIQIPKEYLKTATTSPKPIRKRKLDEHYSSNTSPPAKIKTTQASNIKGDLQSDKSDYEDVKNVIKEEKNMFEPEIYSVDDTYVEDGITNPNKIEDSNLNPPPYQSVPSTSEVDNITLDDNSYASGSYNEEDSNDWQGDDPNMTFPAINYGSAEISNASPLVNRGFFPCVCCKKLFNSRAHLAIHMRTHTGEKPYACKFCPYKAAQSGTLKNHTKTRHKVIL